MSRRFTRPIGKREAHVSRSGLFLNSFNNVRDSPGDHGHDGTVQFFRLFAVLSGGGRGADGAVRPQTRTARCGRRSGGEPCGLLSGKEAGVLAGDRVPITRRANLVCPGHFLFEGNPLEIAKGRLFEAPAGSKTGSTPHPQPGGGQLAENTKPLPAIIGEVAFSCKKTSKFWESGKTVYLSRPKIWNNINNIKLFWFFIYTRGSNKPILLPQRGMALS